MTVMATKITVTCKFKVLTDDLGATQKTKQTVREYSELLENAGVQILQTLLILTVNHIDFVIEASGLEAAKKAFAEAGISVSGIN